MIDIKTKAQTGKIVINDFSKINFSNGFMKKENDCVQIYNLNNKKGVLQKGLGMKSLTVYRLNDATSETYELDYQSLNLQHINKVMYFKQYFSNTNSTTHRLLVHGSDGKLYVFQMYSELNSLTWMYDLQFTTNPVVLAYKKDGLDSILISANDKLVVWSTGRTPYELTNVPTITSMCVYNDYLYCTIAGESDKIWYTSSLDPETVGIESDSTKYITLSDDCGSCKKIITFKENVYVFRDYGISRLNTYAKKQPTYNQIYSSDSKIYPNTVCECGDYMVFMTRNGIYKFSGTTVSKINALPNILINNINDYAVSTNLQNKYYVALRLDFDDNKKIGCENNADMKNNALIKFDLNDNTFEIMRGVDIKDMLSLKAEFEEKIVVTFNSDNKDKIAEITDDGKYFNEVLPGSYCSNYFIQDDMEPITIRKITCDASKDIQLKITTESQQYTFTTSCDGVNEFQTIIPCKKFKIEITSNVQLPYVNLIQFEYVKRK